MPEGLQSGVNLGSPSEVEASGDGGARQINGKEALRTRLYVMPLLPHQIEVGYILQAGCSKQDEK